MRLALWKHLQAKLRSEKAFSARFTIYTDLFSVVDVHVFFNCMGISSEAFGLRHSKCVCRYFLWCSAP
jgi:hypothetical protein